MKKKTFDASLSLVVHFFWFAVHFFLLSAMVRIVPIVYNRDDKRTDFAHLIEDDEFMRTSLLLYSENVKRWIDWTDVTPGSGSAAIRPHAWSFCQDRAPKCLGIPTGFSADAGGFKQLGFDEKRAIDIAFKRVIALCRAYPQIDKICFSADAHDQRKIGTMTFRLCDAVVDYICKVMWDLPRRIETTSINVEPLAQLRTYELTLTGRMLVEDKYAKLLRESSVASRVARASPVHVPIKRLRTWF